MGFKTIKNSDKYQYVTYRQHLTSNGAKKYFWQARIQRKGKLYRAFFNDEKDAALAIDRFLISLGLSPINILKKKE